MQALEYWKTVTADRVGFIERLLRVLQEGGVRYCVIGGQAVNAYVEPVVSLDLDLAVAAADLPRVEEILAHEFKTARFPHSLNVSASGSDVRVQVQTDPRYASFVDRATVKDVLGLAMPVAHVEDVLQGKVWAAQDPGRRASKRQKDLADVARLLELRPDLRDRVPADVLHRLV